MTNTKKTELLTDANFYANLHPKQCKSMLEKARWNNEIDMLTASCPYCESKKIRDYTAKCGIIYKCNVCQNPFDIFTRTILHNTRLSYKEIMSIIILYKHKIKDNQIAKELNIDKRTIARITNLIYLGIKKNDKFIKNILDW